MSDTEPIRTGRIRLGRNTGILVVPAVPVEESPHANETPDVIETPAVGPDVTALIEAPFPEARLLRWMPEREPGEKAPENEVALVVTQEVLVDVNRHVSRTLDRELGGFLLGNLYLCPNTDRQYLMIDQSTRAHFIESSDVHLAFRLDTWAHLAEELNGKFLGKLVVGWYHSHPRMDVFLSGYDVAIHEERFPESWTTALVIEPEKNRGGFFRWQDGKLNPRAPFEFYELVARRAEGSVVDWTNHVLAGGHRPEPVENGKRSGPFHTGGLSNRKRARDTGDLEEPDETEPRRSAFLLVLGGIVLGAVLCAGVWLAVDRYLAASAGAPAAAPSVVQPVGTAEPSNEPSPSTQPAPEVAPSSTSPDGRAADPLRRKAAPKSKSPPKASNQGGGMP